MLPSTTAEALYWAAQASPLPGSGQDQASRLQGPWLQTQLSIAAFVGILSFLVFCFLRTRSKVLYAPRTLLQGFSPHEVHSKNTFFGWILPTLRTSEFTVLQIVGLDAAVLLNFFKSSFYFFTACSVLAAVALVPINYRENGTTEGLPPPSSDPDDEKYKNLYLQMLGKKHQSDPAYHGTTLYLTSHLIFTYIFSLLALYQLYENYRSFIHTRQLFSLDHALSAPARTVVITALPSQLQSERVLAKYWEDLGMTVESVGVGRRVSGLRRLLEDRTAKLLELEAAWMNYVGNPVSKKAMESGYNRDEIAKQITESREGREEGAHNAERSRLQDEDVTGRLVATTPPQTPGSGEGENARLDDPERQAGTTARFEIDGKKRPTFRTRLLTNTKADLLDHLAHQYRVADEAVRKRRAGRFKPTNVAFVTFKDLADAQIAAQVAHYPQPNAMFTALAPDPRDIHWHNMLLSSTEVQTRRLLVLGAVVALLFFWAIPVGALASLLSYEAIKKYAPWLAKLIDRNERIQVLVQNSLPSLALISFNGLLPFILDWLSILQGCRSRTEIEYSLLVKYHFFLVVNVFFLFVTVTTVDLARDLADQPMKFVNKLALSLPSGRGFFISYVMLAGIGLMPLQLLQLPVLFPRWIYRLFYTRTPRDFAELNTPPPLSLGTVYPQALLVFLICITYSVIAPMILLFGAAYFGLGYLVYKYKLLFVNFQPYESRGQAWPLSFTRVCWGLVIFQIFMTGLLALREATLLSLLLLPLLFSTVYISWYIHNRFASLSDYVNLSQAEEVKRARYSDDTLYEAGALADDIARLRKGHPVSQRQSELNRGRYERSEERMYVVKQDSKTDYAQPPMSEAYYGILNTGQIRYRHPAISGRLPTPWLPAERKEYRVATSNLLPSNEDLEAVQEPLDLDLSSSGAIAIDIRRRWRDLQNVTKRIAVNGIERMRSPTPARQTGTSGRRSAGSGAGLRDEAEYIANSAAAWARDGSEPSQSRKSSRHEDDTDALHSDDDDSDLDEDERANASRYTYYPHRPRRTSGASSP